MAKPSYKHQVSWYAENRSLYQSLSEIVAATLRALLKNSNIDYIDIPHRAKTIKSFQEKIVRKKYKDPQSEMMDLAGIRVITYIESDVEKVSELIRSNFKVHPDSSADKAVDLGQDRFGYRSVHFVCDIGSLRESLPEFSPYKNILFEIQVRTALQHAWAEIEHDRSYKFSGELPSQIKRRFHLVAGLLELADREFNELTQEIDSYSSEVHRQADLGNLNIEINSTSILEFLSFTLSKCDFSARIEVAALPQYVIEELKLFGISSLDDLNSILNSKFLSVSAKFIERTNSIGFLRDAMMYEDIDRYFEVSWRGAWQGIDEAGISLLAEKYGENKVVDLLKERNIDFLDRNYLEDDNLLEPELNNNGQAPIA